MTRGVADLMACRYLPWLVAVAVFVSWGCPSQSSAAVDDAREPLESLRALSKESSGETGVSPDHGRQIATQERRIQLAEQILTGSPADDLRKEAILAQFDALRQLAALAEPTALVRLRNLADKYQSDSLPTIASAARQFKVRASLQGFLNGDIDQVQILAEAVPNMLSGPELTPAAVDLAAEAAHAAEKNEDYELARQVYADLARAVAAHQEAPWVAKAHQAVESGQRRLSLLGQPLAFDLVDVKGRPVTDSDLAGKVVLIDFWATWCQPCLAAMPAARHDYERYKDLGFEIIGLCMDDDAQAVAPFIRGNSPLPWIVVMPQETADRGLKNSLARAIGVATLPTNVLVNRDGKVISVSARGAQLQQRLRRLFDDRQLHRVELPMGLYMTRAAAPDMLPAVPQ